MNVNEKIHIEEYSSLWNIYAQSEIAILKSYLGIDTMEHIGSTAINGMKAKPIIDLLIGINEFPPDNTTIQGMENQGYVYMKENSVPNRLYFVKRKEVSYNVHIVKYNGSIWRTDLTFIDYMRAHPEEVQNYISIKEQIINSGVDTLLEYSQSKSDYIMSINNKL